MAQEKVSELIERFRLGGTEVCHVIDAFEGFGQKLAHNFTAGNFLFAG